MAKDTATETLLTIEQYKENQNIDDCVFAGVKAANDWAEGKLISEAKFNAAIRKFLNNPIGGERK